MENIKEYFLVEPQDDYNDEEMTSVFVNGIYFHGQLEKDLGYDLVRVEGIKLLNKLFISTQTGCATYETKVLVDNELKDCIVFCWLGKEDNRFRGLVTYKNDKEFVKDAREKYELRVDYL
jgi:hypothetical protein